LIRAIGGKVLGQQVWRDPPFMLAVCCLLETAFLMRFEIVFAHQAGDAVAADADAIFLKVMPDARRAIGFSTFSGQVQSSPFLSSISHH
jgi:hypothetical protein